MLQTKNQDFFLAFSTGNIIPHYPKNRTFSMIRLADTHLNPLIAATVEATEEAILNALFMATTMVGRDNRKVEAIDLDRLKEMLGSGYSKGLRKMQGNGQG